MATIMTMSSDLISLATSPVRRRLARPLSHRVYQDILRTIDQSAFDVRFRKYWRFFSRSDSTKFLEITRWLLEAIFRYHAYNLQVLSRDSRVLDIGCGAGYFLVVCRHLGLEPVGLDLDDDPIYNEMIEFFDLTRIVHRIEPGGPLPFDGDSFDVVTAFMTCFNRYEDGSPWGAREWCQLATEIRRILRPGGRFIVKFNVNRATGRYYPTEVRRALSDLEGFKAAFWRDSMTLRRV